MRTFAILVIAMVLASSYALTARKPSLATIKKIEKMTQNKKSWSAIIINMALLSAKANNPLDGLIEAINKVVSDIDEKLEAENEAFEIRTGEHNAEIKRLNREVDSANADIARTETFLREVLYVMKATLERDIADLAAEIDRTRKFLEEAAISREAEHNDFLLKLEDANGAIEAVNEAWELLGTLLDGGAPSMIQMNKVKTHVAKVQKKLGKSIDQTIIKALLQLTTNFSDTALVRQVLDALNNVREALKVSIENFTTEEEVAQADYEALVAEKENEIRQMEAETTEKKAQLAACERRIEINEAFVEQRKNDLQDFLDAIVTEDKNYEEDTEAHNDLVAELEKEQGACKEALSILSTAEFSGYLADRINNAGNGPVIAMHSGTGRADIAVTGN